jgi:hypothetical protein
VKGEAKLSEGCGVVTGKLLVRRAAVRYRTVAAFEISILFEKSTGIGIFIKVTKFLKQNMKSGTRNGLAMLRNRVLLCGS